MSLRIFVSAAILAAGFFSFGPVFAQTSGSEPVDHSKMGHSTPAQGMSADQPTMRHEMPGMLGEYSSAREASGTSWQPESSPHTGIHQMDGEWMTMFHGDVNLIYDHQGGARGDDKTFSSSMLMLMGQRSLAGGTFGLRGMASADPFMGKSGYPLLLQTGETANGQDHLVDRQHPHDLFMELAATYSHPVSARSSVFGYVGLPGEPALGPPAFMHRLSSGDNPEAPITHHWLDSTHIAYGVVTLGYIVDRFKIEGSLFRGREPDEHRYDIETGTLDSTAIRLSYNPNRDWSLQVSRGHIKSPEQLEPDINVNRTTASATYNRTLGADNWQTTLAWGRNAASNGISTDAYLLESALTFFKVHTLFGRLERAEKNELFEPGSPLAEETFRVWKLSLGYVNDFASTRHLKFGLGGLVSKYSLPAELDSFYGSDPTSYMIFVRMKIQ
jgi:hypothetical protein